MAICAVQGILSLTLVWSNTAFTDEAYYLWAGRLEIAHWLRGASVPQAALNKNLSGSPILYPPLGALADSIGGLAAARILSLAAMILATILLYLTTARLFGGMAAIAASVLWATSEPVIRLAFATYDPWSVCLTALAAWLIVQAGFRKQWRMLLAASAVSLALSNATAYSGVVIDPVLIAFAFLVWRRSMPTTRAALRVALFTAALAIFFGLLMAASRSWAGIVFTILARSHTVFQSQNIALVLNDIWKYSGFIMVLAVVGSFVTIAQKSYSGRLIVILSTCAAFVIPVAQVYERTAESLDKHLAYGLWFAAMAAAYGFSKLIQPVPAGRRAFATLCCAAVIAYPVVNGLQLAQATYHIWANSSDFIAAFTPVAARVDGPFSLPGAGGQYGHIAQYYLPQGNEWARWDNPGLSLDPAQGPQSSWSARYQQQLSSRTYGAVVLFYATTFSSAPGLPGRFLLTPQGTRTDRELLSLVGASSGEPGLPALTLALETDPDYWLAAVGPYDSDHKHGIYAIWQKRTQT
jgi:4-amino-4-deoxy-L-arabinose transferase-like glycosyltransferase